MLAANILFPSRSEKILALFLRICAGVTGAIVIFIFAFLISESTSAVSKKSFLHFFADSAWYPSEGLYNLLPMLWGTLMASFGAVLLAAPLGILSAIYCRFYGSSRMVWFYRRMIELLAGVPSVVYGFWGLVVLVPLIGQIHSPGPSLIAGVLILTIMILPTMALAADASFGNVPSEFINGAAALGFSKWTTIFHVVAPSVGSSLLTALILQSGRAIGETMAILMVCGNVVNVPENFFAPIRTLTANIALEMAYAMGDHRTALFVSGLVLLLIVAALVFAAEFISRGVQRV